VGRVGQIPSASFFLQRGFGENIDFGPFFQLEKNLGWELLGGGRGRGIVNKRQRTQ
jgi:hypothetical protein